MNGVCTTIPVCAVGSFWPARSYTLWKPRSISSAVFGGSSTAAWIEPAKSAAVRWACEPIAMKVMPSLSGSRPTALSALRVAMSAEPPGLEMPIFFPLRSCTDLISGAAVEPPHAARTRQIASVASLLECMRPSLRAIARPCRVRELVEGDRLLDELIRDREVHLHVEAGLRQAPGAVAAPNAVDELHDEQPVEALELLGCLGVAENRAGEHVGARGADEVQRFLVGGDHPLHEVRLRLNDVLARHQGEAERVVGPDPVTVLWRVPNRNEREAGAGLDDAAGDGLPGADGVDPSALEGRVDLGGRRIIKKNIHVLFGQQARLLEVHGGHRPAARTRPGDAHVLAAQIGDRLHLILQRRAHEQAEDLAIVRRHDRLPWRAREARDRVVHEGEESEVELLGDDRGAERAARAEHEVRDLDVLLAEVVLRVRDQAREVE